MKIQRTLLLTMAAAFIAVSMSSCESTTSVALSKSDPDANYQTNGHDANYWTKRGMTVPSTQLQ
jgi:hypothetical protein